MQDKIFHPLLSKFEGAISKRPIFALVVLAVVLVLEYVSEMPSKPTTIKKT
jgi:hypothetical protein